MRGRHRKRTGLLSAARRRRDGGRRFAPPIWTGLETRRHLLGVVLVVCSLIASGTALAADETTTTTEPSTTTTVEASTTTTMPEESTTSFPDSTSTTVESPTTTTIPSETTTTAPVIGTVPTTPTITPRDPNPPDPEPEASEFRVGSLPAPPMVFPLLGPRSYIDTFGAPRDGGRRRHAGIDIFAEKGVPVVSIAGGVIEEIGEQTLAGQYVIVLHDSGWRSKYLHFDDDTPGTDDGRALGYAEGIFVGQRVEAGTILGFVGDSGNAESTVPHLHFGLFQPNGLPINPYRALVQAPEAEAVYPTPPVRTFNTELVGHLDPDRSGFNGSLAVSGDHIYIGTLGNEDVCPGTGVRVVDVSEPSAPAKVTAFAAADEFPRTSTENLWVGAVDTTGFEGKIAVVGLRLCDESARSGVGGRFAGLAIYDVTDPADPVLLSTVDSGEQTRGVYDIDVYTDGRRIMAVATVPDSYLDRDDGMGDVRVYDLTDIENVVQVSDWDVRQDAPPLLTEALRARVGDDSLSAQSVTWAGAEQVVVAHSAAGLVTLDVADPSRPVYVGSTSIHDAYGLVTRTTAGETHGVEAQSGWVLSDSYLVQNDLGLQPMVDENGEATGWGRQSIYDQSDPSHPRLVSTIGTYRSLLDLDGQVLSDGYYNARASRPFGDSFELVAWLSDGVRVVDLRDPARPMEVASFTPPPRPDPHGWWTAPDGSRELPLVWSVETHGQFVYMSDVNSGLWVFRLRIPVVDRGVPGPQ